MRQEVQAPRLPASCLWILRYIYARLELVGVGTEYARCVSLNFEPMCMNTPMTYGKIHTTPPRVPLLAAPSTAVCR